MVEPIYYANPGNAKDRRTMSLRPTWVTLQVGGHPELYRKTLLTSNNNNN